ncbi:MAG: hypothetical protein MI717_06450 [Spirochaetales bacterium]|nr:hypothetical protein [Spirochaetales bacterium]
MSIHYYLTLHPMEALVASQLEPEVFGAYMAVGTEKGASEQLMFCEVEEDAVAASFDVEYAQRRCVPHSDGRLKNSVYLSVYRVLEAFNPARLGPLWLTTRDGRSLALTQGSYSDPNPWRGNGLYQELCPAHPLVVSSLNPKHFAQFLVSDSGKLALPAVFFADIAIPEEKGGDFTGNIGDYFDQKKTHLAACLADLEAGKGKLTKVVDRSSSSRFGYQVIGRGFYIGSQTGTLAFYPMLSREELKKHHYDWAKSALIL